MAGYDGYSKSNNAVDAEECGRFPMTKAKRIVAKQCGITQKEAKIILTEFSADEYHHTSKFYNATDYYDTAGAIRVFNVARFFAYNPTDLPFLGACSAWGLQDEDDYERFFSDEMDASCGFGEPDRTQAERFKEFREDVDTCEYLSF